MRTGSDNVVDDDCAVLLPLPPEAGIELLIQFQQPRQAIPDDGGTAFLKIQPVPARGGLQEADRDLSGVPVRDVQRCR